MPAPRSRVSSRHPPGGDELERAFEFIRLADMFGTREARSRMGTAVLTPELPLRLDSNYLLVDPVPRDVEAPAVAAEADHVLGGAGLRQRCVMLRDAGAGERLAPGFVSLGWDVFRGLVMALRRPPERMVDTSLVERTDAATLRPARAQQLRGYPWATPEVIRQLLDARALAPVPTQHFAIFDAGRPVAWAELYVQGSVAQVEAVATAATHRRRGHASALIVRAASTATARGAGLVFLCADAADWPRHLYHRLGFDEIGRYVKFTRT